MAEDDLLVTISGPALSLLFYENTRSHDQIGFLLGEILIYVSKKVTDSERDTEHIKQHINIKTVVSHPVAPFFDSSGKIDELKLTFFLKEHARKVIGWYHYRTDVRLVPTFRDKRLHTELSTFFSKQNDLLSKETFMFCLLTSLVSETGGTHKFKHRLLYHKSGMYKPTSLKINNLGADASRPDGTDYKPTPKYSSNNRDAFDKVYLMLNNELSRTSGVQAVTLIQKAAEQLLDQLIPEVTKTDNKVSELEQQLMLLRNKIYTKAFERAHLECEMQEMQVNTKSEIYTEPKSPKSPEIFDSPKSFGASGSGDSKVAAKMHITHGDTEIEKIRDKTMLVPDIALITQGKDYNPTPMKSSSSTIRQLEILRSPKESSGSSSTGTIEKSRTPKSKKQQTVDFIESTARQNNHSNTRPLKYSPNHESIDS